MHDEQCVEKLSHNANDGQNVPGNHIATETIPESERRISSSLTVQYHTVRVGQRNTHHCNKGRRIQKVHSQLLKDGFTLPECNDAQHEHTEENDVDADEETVNDTKGAHGCILKTQIPEGINDTKHSLKRGSPVQRRWCRLPV